MNSLNFRFAILALVFVPVVLLFVTGCSDNSNPFYPENLKDYTFDLSGKKLVFDTLKSPYRIYSVNDYLVITQDGRVAFDEPVMHLFSKSDYTHLRGKGRNGLGPNEISNADLIDFDPSDTALVVHSSMSKRLSKFSLDNDNLLSKKELILPENMTQVYNMYKASDTTYLGLATLQPYIFNEYDTNGEWINGYGSWPEVPDNNQLAGYDGPIKSFLLSRINGGWYKKQINGDWYALAMAYRDRIELFNYKTKELITVEGPEYEVQPFKVGGAGANVMAAYDRSAKFGYRDLAFGKKNTYALYGGYSELEFQKTGVLAKTVFVLSEDFKVKAKLNLDRSVLALAVDEELQKIYAITTDENPGLVIFDIPEPLVQK